MPSIRERSAAPPKRLVVRIAVAIGFVSAIAIAAAYVEGRDKARDEAAGRVMALVRDGRAREALEDGVAAGQRFGGSRDLSRSLWASLMSGGGLHARALFRRTLAYAPLDSLTGYRLMFSNDGRFLAAIDDNRITVWNVENGKQLVATEAGDRIVGYWRIGARHVGLLASHQYYDLVNSVIELPDGFRYAQPSKDAVTAVAPGGDWAYFLPRLAAGRSDYPVKLINLHSGERREVDAGYKGQGPVAVSREADRIATASDGRTISLWNARTRSVIARLAAPGPITTMTFSSALESLVAASAVVTGAQRGAGSTDLSFVDQGTGELRFRLRFEEHGPWLAVADDPKGIWFAIGTRWNIILFRGPYAPSLTEIAEKEFSRAPATSR